MDIFSRSSWSREDGPRTTPRPVDVLNLMGWIGPPRTGRVASLENRLVAARRLATLEPNRYKEAAKNESCDIKNSLRAIRWCVPPRR
jgi:hypothetical protein